MPALFHCWPYGEIFCQIQVSGSGGGQEWFWGGSTGWADMRGARGYIVYMVWYMVCVAKLNKRCDNKQMIQIDTKTDGDSWEGKTL